MLNWFELVPELHVAVAAARKTPMLWPKGVSNSVLVALARLPSLAEVRDGEGMRCTTAGDLRC